MKGCKINIYSFIKFIKLRYILKNNWLKECKIDKYIKLDRINYKIISNIK